VLFLVDRNNPGDQTLREFRDYTTPDDGRKFTELYNVDKLTGAGMVGSSKVVISTIQRVHSVLRGLLGIEGFDVAADVLVFGVVEVGYAGGGARNLAHTGEDFLTVMTWNQSRYSW
jgi:type I restriction enzyme R subunit